MGSSGRPAGRLATRGCGHHALADTWEPRLLSHFLRPVCGHSQSGGDRQADGGQRSPLLPGTRTRRAHEDTHSHTQQARGYTVTPTPDLTPRSRAVPWEL